MKQTDIPKLQKKKKSYNAFVFYLDFNGNRTRLKYYCVYHKNVTRTYDPNKTFVNVPKRKKEYPIYKRSICP